MNKKQFIGMLWLYGIFGSVYFVTMFTRFEIGSNILSVLGMLFATGNLMYVSKKVSYFNSNWKILALTPFTWAICDFIWLVEESFLGLDPSTDGVLMYLYTIPNVMLVFASIRYVMYEKWRWDIAQIVVDIVATSLVFIGLIGIAFVEPTLNSGIQLDHLFISSCFFLIMDAVLMALIGVIVVSSRLKNASYAIKSLIISMVLFCIVDSIYVIQTYQETYISNQWTDWWYFVTLMLLGVSGNIALYKPYTGPKKLGLGLPENIGHRGYGAWLLIVPIGLYLSVGIELSVALVFVSIIMMNQILSVYIQKLSQTEFGLRQKTLANDKLEEEVALRVKELKDTNIQLEKLIKLDAITHMYNRRYFLDFLEAAFQEVEPGEKIYLFLLDIDRFKLINDLYGHEIGDLTLQEMCRKIYNHKQGRMIIARLGGDEFAIVLKTSLDSKALEPKIQAIIDLCEQPMFIQPFSIQLSVRTGVAYYPNDADNGNTLLKHAETALYKAKKQGDLHFAFFDSLSSEQLKRHHKIEMMLKKANYDQEFQLHYQPQYTVDGKRLIGMEALIRWHNAELGMVPPAEFIPIAEETGAIIGISHWVMREAFSQIKKWNTTYNAQWVMGINISPLQINGIHFIKEVEQLLVQWEVLPQWINLEVTENSAMAGDSAIEEIFTILNTMGIKVSVDDFGTGYSSLSYLKRFHIDYLKIDKSLIDFINTDHVNQQIVRAVVMMAKALDLETIAEGVEEPIQLEILEAIGCNEIQGYIFGKPAIAAEFEQNFLEHN